MDGNRDKAAEEKLWRELVTIPDPEIPVVTLAEMGILREIRVEGESVRVSITPTFSGCPALQAMKSEIITRLESAGYDKVEVHVELSPAWTTDWISESAKEKLKEFGILPPVRHQGNFQILLESRLVCPFCESENTDVRNQFGPTPCRALAYCHNCQQPFEWFKPI